MTLSNLNSLSNVDPCAFQACRTQVDAIEARAAQVSIGQVGLPENCPAEVSAPEDGLDQAAFGQIRLNQP